ncbi:hypothetical protein FSP39_011725 [Pinctada imbricata]|uniref:Uncharacterized protein n=1 Tax=Pinctada imbricata TaxID=66713 RepID=A0AA89BX32_PINIB|nr:hypothetical protein FSP39_011725 [Pinctada imbricata]
MTHKLKLFFIFADNQQSVFVGQQIKRIINCPKCKKLFHKPRNLPCGHTFCHPCIVNLLHINEKTCPTCKECVTLRKEQDVEKLSINTLISDLINMNKKYEFWQINNASNNPCDMCSKPESLNFCIDCLKYMCSTCSASHSKWPALKTHFILEVNTENEPIIELRKKKPQCNKHGNEVVSFCVNCDHGVCEECKSSCPKDHLFEDLHSHCKDLRKVISQHIRKSSIKIEHYSKCVERYEKKEQEMIQEREIALEEVGSLMNAIHRLLDQKAESMRSSIHEKHNRMNQRLHSEKQIILEEKIKLLSRIEYLQFLYEYGSDAHIVTEYEESQASLVDTGVQPNIDILDTFVIEFKKIRLLRKLY